MQIGTLFLVHNPSKKAHPQNEIRVPMKAQISATPCFFATFSQRNVNLPRKARILDTPCFFTTLSQRNANLPRKAGISDTPCFFATLSQRNANLPRNSTNFSNAMFLCYLEPGKNAKNQPKNS